MIIAMVICASICAIFGASLWAISVRLGNKEPTLVEQINALLPQTQCAQCNFPGCQPYAEAIVSGEAAINQCPPGGHTTIAKLANLLGQETLPLNPNNGIEQPAKIAFIHEDLCIGCKKCILACPVDAILGAAKKMHTVIAQECTGCDLCLAPCPVDCIEMVTPVETIATWRAPHPLTSS